VEGLAVTDRPRVLPSGEQFELTHGRQRAVVTEVGGGLRSYTSDGADILDGYGAREMCRGGRGQVLVPWPNRLGGGRYRFGGSELQLPINEPERGNAIHGLVRWASWQAGEQEEARLVMRHLLHPQPGYPFTLELTVEYQLSPRGLTVTTTGTNRGTSPLPFGAGFHPYLTVGAATVDDAFLSLPAHAMLETDDNGIPTGTETAVDGSPYDFRHRRPVAGTRLDTCFSGLERGPEGTTRATMSTGDGGRQVTLWADGSFPYLMVFTGDTLQPDRRRRSLAVEPMTCAPDAFNNGLGLLVLQPGEQVSGSWGISVA
jgi:aldose 1-epimerase